MYEPCAIAEVEMTSAYMDATSGAFRYLFNYISRENSSSTPIAMTAPVISTADKSASNQLWKIAFVMPSGMTLSDLPTPNNAMVKIIDKEEEEAVALGFRGRANEKLASKKEAELREAVGTALPLSDEVRICRNDFNTRISPQSHH
jgi:hypothetical protein